MVPRCCACGGHGRLCSSSARSLAQQCFLGATVCSRHQHCIIPPFTSHTPLPPLWLRTVLLPVPLPRVTSTLLPRFAHAATKRPVAAASLSSTVSHWRSALDHHYLLATTTSCSAAAPGPQEGPRRSQEAAAPESPRCQPAALATPAAAAAQTPEAKAQHRSVRERLGFRGTV